jgi:hypothetical protein
MALFLFLFAVWLVSMAVLFHEERKRKRGAVMIDDRWSYKRRAR